MTQRILCCLLVVLMLSFVSAPADASWLGDAWEGAKNVVSKVVDVGKKVVNKVVEWCGGGDSVVGKIVDGAKKIFEKGKGLFEVGKDIWNGVKGIIQSPAFKNAFNKVVDIVKGDGSLIEKGKKIFEVLKGEDVKTVIAAGKELFAKEGTKALEKFKNIKDTVKKTWNNVKGKGNGDEAGAGNEIVVDTASQTASAGENNENDVTPGSDDTPADSSPGEIDGDPESRVVTENSAVGKSVVNTESQTPLMRGGTSLEPAPATEKEKAMGVYQKYGEDVISYARDMYNADHADSQIKNLTDADIIELYKGGYIQKSDDFKQKAFTVYNTYSAQEIAKAKSLWAQEHPNANAVLNEKLAVELLNGGYLGKAKKELAAQASIKVVNSDPAAVKAFISQKQPFPGGITKYLSTQDMTTINNVMENIRKQKGQSTFVFYGSGGYTQSPMLSGYCNSVIKLIEQGHIKVSIAEGNGTTKLVVEPVK